jgi:hypothetical protein
VVAAKDPKDIAVIQIGYSRVFLPPPSVHPPRNFRLRKHGQEVDIVRIA